MVTDPMLLLVCVLHLEAHVVEESNRFKDREAILPATAEIIDLATTRVTEEVQQHVGHIAGMHLVPDLLPLVAEDRVGPTSDGTHDNIGQIAVELDCRMLRTGQAPPTKDADRHLEVAPKLLAQHISRHLGGAEERM